MDLRRKVGDSQPGRRSKYLPWLIGGILVIVFGVGGWWLWRRSHLPAPIAQPPVSTAFAAYDPIELTGMVSQGTDGRSAFLSVANRPQPYFIDNITTPAVAAAFGSHLNQSIHLKGRLVIAQGNQLFVSWVDGVGVVDQLQILPAHWNSSLTDNQRACLTKKLTGDSLTEALVNNLAKLTSDQVSLTWNCVLRSENQ